MSHNPGLHTLGQVRELTGLSDRRIRYYEQQGLLAPLRSQGRQRLYTAEDVERLRRIKQLLDAGVSLRHVRAELDNAEASSSADEPGDAASHFRAVRWVRGDARDGLHQHPDALHRAERDEEE
jgi:MerR family glutamine synthetase transcriptional repressor